MPEGSFNHLYHQVVNLLESIRSPYLIIGGMATGVLGEPRLTHDIDAIIDADSKIISALLHKAKATGFSFNEQTVMNNRKQKGTFRLHYHKSWVDLIIASTEIERVAFSRAHRVKVLGIEASFPSPEDFILFKLIPGRPKDLLDVESVILRHQEKLDKEYLNQWAQRLSDEMEDLRIYNTLKKLLGN